MKIKKIVKQVYQINEWIYHCIKKENEYIYNISPNPEVGEIIIATMDRRWCHGNENERVIFQYTKNGWKELGDGHYPNCTR